MNDRELQALLRAAQPRTRSAEEREAFTAGVMARLHRNRAVEPEQSSWFAPLAWGVGMAFAAVAIGFSIGRIDPALPVALRQSERQWRASLVAQAQQLGFMMDSENAVPGVANDAH